MYEFHFSIDDLNFGGIPRPRVFCSSFNCNRMFFGIGIFLRAWGRVTMAFELGWEQISIVKNERQLNGGAKKSLSVSSCAAKFVACRVATSGLGLLRRILQLLRDNRVIASGLCAQHHYPSGVQAFIAVGKLILPCRRRCCRFGAQCWWWAVSESDNP